MTTFRHGAFIAELRKRQGAIPKDLYADLVAALEAGLNDRPSVSAPIATGAEPPWLVEARRHMGLKEIPGKHHNDAILAWTKKLGGWWAEDETPWCGTFVGFCMLRAGHTPPKYWMRAKDWMNFGKETPPRTGAIAVFGREGGGHVGFVVGESAAALHVLGGNQSNMVSVMPIEKRRLIGLRWPAALPLSDARPPAMSGGTISVNEA